MAKKATRKAKPSMLGSGGAYRAGKAIQNRRSVIDAATSTKPKKKKKSPKKKKKVTYLKK